MNKKNLNCHPELLAKTCQSDALTRECHPERVEGSQQNCTAPRDVAEDAKLNHEIAEELRKYTPASLENKGSKFSSKLALNRKRMGLNKTVCLLTLFTFLPTLAQAETCTPTPDCKSLGYTETFCPDGGGIKCPWNTNLMFCCKKCASVCEIKACSVGDVLYEDKKCYLCPNRYTLPGKISIGVVFATGKAIGLTDLGKTGWNNAKSTCNNYNVSGIKGWYLPSESELLTVYNNINNVQEGFANTLDSTKLASIYYWSTTSYNYNTYYGVVDPVSGSLNKHNVGDGAANYTNFRCVLKF